MSPCLYIQELLKDISRIELLNLRARILSILPSKSQLFQCIPVHASFSSVSSSVTDTVTFFSITGNLVGMH